ncbi:MAG: hypothetical protein A2Z04_00960 [Chloroflexi bacterium RBG_16_57_9]|nr:MAG: hypothetical protein A2Z04_00960 [Chloroflexi bacterium RBG_16_57_9]
MPEIDPNLITQLVQTTSRVLQILVFLLGAGFAAFSIGLAVWTFRDIRSRTRDSYSQLLAVLLVLFLNVFGWVLYLLLRPKEQLSEAYERALAEEALLSGLEGRSACPQCQAPVEADFRVCPACHTQLKQACPTCARLLRMDWDICPYCAKPLPATQPA